MGQMREEYNKGYTLKHKERLKKYKKEYNKRYSNKKIENVNINIEEKKGKPILIGN